MKNKLYIIVGMALMAVLAIISARILQEPVQPSNSNQPPSQILSDEVPLTQVPETSPQDQGVASLVSDRVAGSAEVTEAPQNRQPLSNIVLNDPAQTQSTENLPELPALDLPGPNINSRPESQISDLPMASAEPASPAENAGSQAEQTASASTQTASTATTATESSSQTVTESSSQTAGTQTGSASTATSTNAASSPATSSASTATSANTEANSPSNTLTTRAKLPSEAGKNVIINARLNLDGESINLRLEGNGPLSGKAFSLSGPDRAVLDLEGTWKLSSPTVPSNRMLGAIRVGQQDKATRLVLDMRVKPQTVEVVRIGANVIELRVR